jgi:lysophospholipid acyltransferase (LPLAT)-like uncharacterized protein
MAGRAQSRSQYNSGVAEMTTQDVAMPAPPAWDTQRYSLWQRIVLRLIIWAGYALIRLLGPTLRVSVSFEEGAQRTIGDRPLIESFWHSCMIPATYICRNLGVRVMSSNSYDGEYMGRIIHKFGFVAVKGSSTRNAVRALLGLRRALEEGWTVAFTLDGPRGPRRKVKPGPVALARSSGVPLSMFHAAVDRAWVLNTWDRLMIPVPFARVLVRFGKLIPVPHAAGEDDLERYAAELQASLDRVCEFAEANVRKVGTAEFPIGR